MQATQRDRAPATRPSRVLLVEDEPNILELLTSSLELSGFTTRGAPDAETALLGLDGFAPDIAVVDVSLPGRSGLELVADLRASRPGLPVLFLTARDTVEDRLAGLRAAAGRLPEHSTRRRGHVDEGRKNSSALTSTDVVHRHMG